MTNLERILDISKRLGLTHVGSNVSCLPVLEEIYSIRKPGDIVILSNAHAHLAHLIVKNEYTNQISDIEKEISRDIHCNRESGCDASGGSLGHGIGIGIGYALADRSRMVYVIVSDGSMMEGSEWEALRIANSLGLTNLSIHCNFNGYTAVAKSNIDDLERKMKMFNAYVKVWRTDNGLPELAGLKGHYEKLT